MRGCFANTISDKDQEDSNVNTCQIQRNCFFELSMTTAAQELATETSHSFKLSFLGVGRTGIKIQVVQITSTVLWWEKVEALWAQGILPFQTRCPRCMRSSCSLSRCTFSTAVGRCCEFVETLLDPGCSCLVCTNEAVL